MYVAHLEDVHCSAFKQVELTYVDSFFQLVDLKGHTKELRAKTKTEEEPKKDTEKAKLSNKGTTSPDPTDEEIAEKERPCEKLLDENDV